MTEIKLKSKVMAKNDQIAEEIRSQLHSHDIQCINLIGSPGSGKTTLLEKTIPLLKEKWMCGVIEGDVKTDCDMKRITALDVPSVQIQTQGSCHLSAEMIKNVLSVFSLEQLDFLVIENVGNLICPVAYDLGEDHRLIIVSITEGAENRSSIQRHLYLPIHS
ncbi:Hydrogenase maturation factor HypB [subsurface metagenome]